MNNEDIPWFTIEDIRKQGRIISSTQKYITSKALKETSVKLLPKNTVLICCTASIGEHAITKIELTTNQQFNGMVIKEAYKNRLLPEYLFWVTSTFKNELLRLSGKTSFEFVSVKTLKTIEIPLPPLEIQEEIVKELDGYQAVIDGAQKVVDNWKPTLPINPNWEKVKLGDVCKLTYGYTDTALEIGDTRFIRITDIDIFGQIKDYDCKYINSNNETDKYLLHNNDIIVARTGATYGKTALFKGDYKAVYASFLIKLDFDKTKVYNPYYWAFAQSQDYINQAAKLVSGVAQPQFNANAIKNIEFYIPSIEIQKEIVLKIQEEEKAIEECKKLIKLHQEKINTKIQSIWGDSCE